MSVVVVVGNPKPNSRTLAAAQLVAERVAGHPADTVIDLVDVGAQLLDWSSPAVAEAVEQVQQATVVVFASPTYKGSYTGLLKLFLDRIGGGALRGVIAIPLLLGGDLRHALAPEAFLKPVLAELGASSPTRGLFIVDKTWEESPELAAWLQSEEPVLEAIRDRLGTKAAA